MVSFANTIANKNKLTETLGSPMASYGFGASGYETVYDNEDRLTTWKRNDNTNNQSWSLARAAIGTVRVIEPGFQPWLVPGIMIPRPLAWAGIGAHRWCSWRVTGNGVSSLDQIG